MVGPCGPPLGGRYELQTLLATGGMGQVWRGRDVLLGRPVAVKVLRSEYTGDPTFLARFRIEARHAALLAHRNIAAVYDYGEVPAEVCGEHLAYLVMELVDGEPLSAVLAREERLGVDRTLDVLRQTAAALGAAHAAGVVHRDVKPGNLLVGTDGVVRMTDFGVAWSASDVPLTQTGQVVGTAQYLSPEQADGGKAGPASDVYALGMIGYECLAGHRAFDGGTPVQIALRQLREEPAPLPDDVPGPVRTLIGRALRKNPAERFADGAAFRDAVEDVLAGRPLEPLPVDPPTLPLPATVGGGRRGVRRLLVPIVALLAGAGIGGGAVLHLLAPPEAGSPAVVAAPETNFVLRSADYVGRPVEQVEADLVARGLRVARTTHETADVAPGTVLGLGPVGAVRPGELVTLTVSAALPAPVPPPLPESTTVEAGAPAPAPAPAPAAPVDAVDAVDAVDGEARVADHPGNGSGHVDDPGPGSGEGQGNGNGHGNDRGGNSGPGNGKDE